MDELVDEDLHLLRVAPESTRDRLQPRDVAVMVGPEHVDEPLVPPVPLEPHVRDVDREIRGPPVRAEDDAVLVVAPLGRREPARSFLLVELDLGERLFDERLHLALVHPEVHVHAEALERLADALLHHLHGVGVELGQLAHVVPLVAVGRRLLPPAPRVDRLVEEVDLRAAVVDVELALDRVAREVEQAGDGISVRGVPR